MPNQKKGRPDNRKRVIKGRIKLAMKENGCTPAMLADGISVSLGRVNHIIPAEYIDKDQLNDIGKFLGIAPEYFTGEMDMYEDNLYRVLPGFNDDGKRILIKTEKKQKMFPPYEWHLAETIDRDEITKLLLTKCEYPQDLIERIAACGDLEHIFSQIEYALEDIMEPFEDWEVFEESEDEDE